MRVGPGADFLQFGDAYLGVDLGGIEPGVAQQHLDGSDVRAVVVPVGGAAVAKQMAASGFLDPGLLHGTLDPVADVVGLRRVPYPLMKRARSLSSISRRGRAVSR